MLKNIGGDRPLRVCDLCGGVDDHPRHVLTGGNYPKPSNDIAEKVMAAAPEAQRVRLLTDLMDLGSSDRHMDCCRAAGCPDGICNTQTAGAENLRGSALVDHILSKAGE